jgi:hypothetical protein
MGESTLRRFVLAAAAGSLLFCGAAWAQTAAGAGPGVAESGHPRVNQVDAREATQQQRIANGIASGSLNAHEAARLENGESRLQHRESADLATHGGHLTKPEQRRLNRQENRLSRRIAVQKHDAR